MIQVAFYTHVSVMPGIPTWSTNLEILWILQPFRTSPRTSGSCIRVSCPISTERDIYGEIGSEAHQATVRLWLTENDGHVDEKLAERVAVCRQKFRRRQTPMGRVRCTREDILWYRGSIE